MVESNVRDLCERIRRETDPEEFMSLVEELNRTLAQQEGGQKHLSGSETVDQY